MRKSVLAALLVGMAFPPAHAAEAWGVNTPAGSGSGSLVSGNVVSANGPHGVTDSGISSANLPQLNVANTFTAGPQTFPSLVISGASCTNGQVFCDKQGSSFNVPGSGYKAHDWELSQGTSGSGASFIGPMFKISKEENITSVGGAGQCASSVVGQCNAALYVGVESLATSIMETQGAKIEVDSLAPYMPCTQCNVSGLQITASSNPPSNTQGWLASGGLITVNDNATGGFTSGVKGMEWDINNNSGADCPNPGVGGPGACNGIIIKSSGTNQVTYAVHIRGGGRGSGSSFLNGVYCDSAGSGDATSVTQSCLDDESTATNGFIDGGSHSGSALLITGTNGTAINAGSGAGPIALNGNQIILGAAPPTPGGARIYGDGSTVTIAAGSNVPTLGVTGNGVQVENGGLEVGSPTGGMPGAGVINAQSVEQNGVGFLPLTGGTLTGPLGLADGSSLSSTGLTIASSIANKTWAINSATTGCLVDSLSDAQACNTASDQIVLMDTTGGGVLGQPASGYGHTYNAYPILIYHLCSTNCGWNQDTADNGGRTGDPEVYMKLDNSGGSWVQGTGGQGDVTGISYDVYNNATRAGATNVLASPAITYWGGTTTDGKDGVYNEAAEFSFHDNGHDVATSGFVIRSDRTNDTGALDAFWNAISCKADIPTLTDEWDVCFRMAGNIYDGIDFTPGNFATNDAMTLAADQRIDLNATAGNPFPLRPTPSTTFIKYSSGTQSVNTVVGNNATLQVYANQVIISAKSGSASSLSLSRGDDIGSGTIASTLFKSWDNTNTPTTYAQTNIVEDSDASGNAFAHYGFQTVQSGSLATRLSVGGGVYVGGASDEGINTFNAGTLYESGTPLASKYAVLSSPALTGTPTAPTAGAGTNTTQIATTAFVNAIFASPPAMGGTTPAAGTFTTLVASNNLTSDAHVISNATALPSSNLAFGAAAGTSPSLTSITGDDHRFNVNFTTGTATTTGVVWTVTFNNAYSTAPQCMLSAAGGNTPGKMATTWLTTTTTTVVLNNTASALTASTAYSHNINCTG